MNVHLSAVVHTRNAAVVGYQRNPPRPAEPTRHAHLARNNRSKPICPDGEFRPEAHRGTPLPEPARAEHSSVAVGYQIGDSNAFGDANSQGPRAAQQDCVEGVAPNRESTIAESAKAMVCEEVAKDVLAVGSANKHPTELGGPSILNELERTHGLEDA
jgi:hypothetical protein